MRKIWIGLTVLSLAAPVLAASPQMEWTPQRTFNLKASPVDLAVTSDGQKTFVLLKGGEIQAWSAEGELLGRYQVDASSDHLVISPSGDQLFISSSENKTLQTVTVDLVHAIDLGNSPVKGAATAPVAIVVFSDFQ